MLGISSGQFKSEQRTSVTKIVERKREKEFKPPISEA